MEDTRQSQRFFCSCAFLSGLYTKHTAISVIDLGNSGGRVTASCILAEDPPGPSDALLGDVWIRRHTTCVLAKDAPGPSNALLGAVWICKHTTCILVEDPPGPSDALLGAVWICKHTHHLLDTSFHPYGGSRRRPPILDSLQFPH